MKCQLLHAPAWLFLLTARYYPIKMKKINLLFQKNIYVLALISIICSCNNPDEEEKPNIILIIADDMNWDDCGAYGHRTIRTANIDKMASDGMRFNNAYLTASSCSPSRGPA